MAKSKTDNHVQSVDRAFSVLEAVVSAGEIGVSELGQKLGLHVATVHNILRTLTARQYLQNVNGRYQPGVSLAILLAHSSPMTVLARLAQPSLESIARTTGEAASLTVLTHTTARLIAFQPGTQAITIQHPQWIWDDPLQLSTGRLLLAFASEELQQTCVQHHKDLGHELSPAAWKKQADTIRTTAEAEALNTNRDHQYAFACAVYGPKQDVLAAIGASCPAFRLEPKHQTVMQTAVRTAARELTTALRSLS